MVYLIQPEQYIGTNTFKVGMSASNTINRTRVYGRHAQYVAMRECENPSNVENRLILEFNNAFGAPTAGKEYFSGNKITMINIFDMCIAQYAKYDMEPAGGASDSTAADNDKRKPIKPTIDYKRTNLMLSDLLSLLPNHWFNDEISLQTLVFAFKNSKGTTGYDDITWQNVLTHAYLQKATSCDQHMLTNMFQTPMNARQQRITLGSIKNKIRTHDPHGYKQWRFRWDRSMKKKLAYKEGAMISMQDAKAIFMSEWARLKPERFSRVNPNIEIVCKPICKSCKRLHRMECCEEYSRQNKSSRQYIINAEVV